MKLLRSRLGLLLGLVLLVARAAHCQERPAALPKVVLLGDSIRLSYTPYVQKALADKAVVVSPKANGGDSGRVLKNLGEWAIREQPAVIHFNCGIHDIKKSKTSGKFQVPPEEYESNLRNIVQRLRSETKAVVLFALTTPVEDGSVSHRRSNCTVKTAELRLSADERHSCRVKSAHGRRTSREPRTKLTDCFHEKHRLRGAIRNPSHSNTPVVPPDTNPCFSKRKLSRIFSQARHSDVLSYLNALNL